MKEFLFENNCPSFIGGWFIDPQICDDVVNFFQNDTYFEAGPGPVSYTHLRAHET